MTHTFGKKGAAYIRANTVYIFLKKFHETDTSLDFLTVEKVAVSLPTKCLSNPTSGSVLIGDYMLGHAHFPGFAYTTQKNISLMASHLGKWAWSNM